MILILMLMRIGSIIFDLPLSNIRSLFSFKYAVPCLWEPGRVASHQKIIQFELVGDGRVSELTICVQSQDIPLH